MSIFKEKSVFTRRQFVKGSGMLFAAAVLAGIFAKIGFEAFDTSEEYIEQRAAGLYSLDESMAIRKSHENPEILQIYKDFLSPGEVSPVSETAHHLLHTKYGKDIPGLIEQLNAHQHEAA
ncbi:MAG TPA: iron hydrogenase small subunit [Syntrophomonadaceae bacterium]|nr:iron hydrogenase small subunit [Syntrophomonadaceae bacterium]HNX28915.1 iron hydrogenase small subunit [Syntrophomonadaceae bacterium]HPR94236.1 iron hydrogenase small subunit [Syntrophomonadaceae bacterium]